jgi:hypothetical protein
MKRYNQVHNGTYEPRSEMVEETLGDWVWWEDVEMLLEAAEDIVTRWDSPLWKMEQHTGVFIDRLRNAIAKAKGDM